MVYIMYTAASYSLFLVFWTLRSAFIFALLSSIPSPPYILEAHMQDALHWFYDRLPS